MDVYVDKKCVNDHPLKVINKHRFVHVLKQTPDLVLSPISKQKDYKAPLCNSAHNGYVLYAKAKTKKKEVYVQNKTLRSHKPGNKMFFFCFLSRGHLGASCWMFALRYGL